MSKVAERPAKRTENLTVAQFLSQKIDSSDKSQSEIAQELGYPNPNIITMFKQGRTKVPITKIGAIAKALEIDPLHFMRIVMNEYSPDTWAVLESIRGNIVSDSEMEIIRTIREAAGEHDVKPSSDDQKQELKNLVNSWIDTSKVIRHR